MELPVRRRKAKRRKTVRNPPPVDDTDSKNEELSPVQEVQKTEMIKNSRLRRQKIKARRCPNIHKIITEDGIMVVRKDIPFKKKSKPGLGESKDCKKGDMMVVTRSQDRKYLGKLICPVVACDYLQPRLGFADRHLQRITYPLLKNSRWITRNEETGTPGYMIVDPRWQESLRWFHKLSKVLRQQDHFLNPDMMAHPKKKKSGIPYADLRD